MIRLLAHPLQHFSSVSILEKSENIVQKSLEEIEIIYLLKNTKEFLINILKISKGKNHRRKMMQNVSIQNLRYA
jgi:hypothetical protein